MEPEKFFETKNPHFDWSSASVAAVSSPSADWVSEYWNGIALAHDDPDSAPHHENSSIASHFSASLSPPRQPLPRLISRDLRSPDADTSGSSQQHNFSPRLHNESWPQPLEALRKLSVSEGSNNQPLRSNLSISTGERARMSDSSSFSAHAGRHFSDPYGPPLKPEYRSFGDTVSSGRRSSRREPSLNTPAGPMSDSSDHHIDPLTSFAFGSKLSRQEDPMLVPDLQSPWPASSPPSHPLSFGALSSNQSHISSVEDDPILRRNAPHHRRRRSFSSASLSPQSSINGMIRAPSSSGSSARARLQQFHHRANSQSSIYSSPVLEAAIKALGGQTIGFTQTTRSIEGVSALRQLTTPEIKQLQLAQHQQALQDVRLVALLLSGYLARRPEFNTSRKRRHQLHQLARLASQRIPIENLERLHFVLKKSIDEAKKRNPVQQLLSGLKEINQLLKVSAPGQGSGRPTSEIPASAVEQGLVTVDSKAVVARLSSAVGLYMNSVSPDERPRLSAQGSEMSIPHAVAALSQTLEDISARSDSLHFLHSEAPLMSSIHELCNLLEQNAHIRQAQQVQERNTHVAITNVLNLISQKGDQPLSSDKDSVKLESEVSPPDSVAHADPEAVAMWPSRPTADEEASENSAEPRSEVSASDSEQEEQGIDEDEKSGTQSHSLVSSRSKRSSSQNSEHRCLVCDKTFSVALGLKRHMRNHTGEKPFQCEVCGARFSQKSSCKRHLRIHTGYRPYKCPICGRGFAQRSNQQRHMKTHTRKQKK